MTWIATITKKNGRTVGRFTIEDVAGYTASLNLVFTRKGPRVWVDADGTKTVLALEEV